METFTQTLYPLHYISARRLFPFVSYNSSSGPLLNSAGITKDRTERTMDRDKGTHSELPQGLPGYWHEWNLHLPEHAEELLYRATHPVEIANRYTSNELIALRHFPKKKPAHMPHLLDCGEFWLTEDDDRQAMVGGFMIGILMTKLPGTQITYEMLWCEKDKEGRDEIRDAFKVALLELWACRINPHDCALRNIMWDENEKKCYLVDFEDYTWSTIADREAFWDLTPRWSGWRLSEDCGPEDRVH